MPTYEYQCGRCGHQMEVFQKMTDAPLSECPNCHQPALTKLLSGGNFQLKGSGWYVTDYRDKGKAKQTKTSEGGSEGTGASDTNAGKTSDSSSNNSSSGSS
jgi:putative FmdB family regulatory protein